MSCYDHEATNIKATWLAEGFVIGGARTSVTAAAAAAVVSKRKQ